MDIKEKGEGIILDISSDCTDHCFGGSVVFFFALPKHFKRNEFVDLKVNTLFVLFCDLSLKFFLRTFADKQSNI